MISLLGIVSYLYSYQNTKNSFFICSDLLLWQIREGGADNWAQIIQEPGIHQEVQLLNAPFQWEPGFRIGVGCTSNNDLWDILFSYTWFKTSAALSTHQTSSFVYSSFLGNFFIDNTNGSKISGPVYRDAGIQWNFLFNTFDLELGRVFQTDEFLTLRPFIGLKSGLINQSITTNWRMPFGRDNQLDPLVPITTFSLANERVTNNSLAIGPSSGLNTSWLLYKTSAYACSIIGNFSCGLLFSRWDLKDLYKNNAPQSVTISNDKIMTALTMIRGNMGIEWHSCFKELMLTIRLSYESQVWFNQLRYYSFNGGRLNDLLSLHGGVFEVCINF